MLRTQLKHAFNNQLQQYLEQLSLLFPEEKDIKMYAKYIDNIKKIFPSTIYKFFNEHVGQMKEHCKNRDEKFFMDLNYDESVGGNNESMMKAIHFKKLWLVMDEESKENTWQQFELLFLLLDKILESKKK
jgi:hypothetical protein